MYVCIFLNLFIYLFVVKSNWYGCRGWHHSTSYHRSNFCEIFRVYGIVSRRYIHNCSFQPVWLRLQRGFSHLPVKCVILYMSGGTYSKINSERLIFWKALHNSFIWSPKFCQKSAERMSPKKYFHTFVLISDLMFEFGLYF